jgi:hypothetical protein
MKYGNCLIGLIVIMFRHRFCGRLKLLFPKNSWMPHLCWYTPKDNLLHDYHVVKDLLPYHLTWLFFQGEFRTRKFKNRTRNK